jgi:hypothetical protein
MRFEGCEKTTFVKGQSEKTSSRAILIRFTLNSGRSGPLVKTDDDSHKRFLAVQTKLASLTAAVRLSVPSRRRSATASIEKVFWISRVACAGSYAWMNALA